MLCGSINEVGAFLICGAILIVCGSNLGNKGAVRNYQRGRVANNEGRVMIFRTLKEGGLQFFQLSLRGGSEFFMP